MQVGFDEGTASPTLAVVTSNILDAIGDNPALPTQIVVTHPGGRESEQEFSDWSPARFRRLDFRGRTLRQFPNPYAVLPFVPLFDYAPDDQFFLKGGADIIAAQKAVNIELANLWRALEWQSHG